MSVLEMITFYNLSLEVETGLPLDTYQIKTQFPHHICCCGSHLDYHTLPKLLLTITSVNIVFSTDLILG